MFSKFIFVIDNNSTSGSAIASHIERNHPTCKVKRFTSGEDMMQFISIKPHLIIIDGQSDKKKSTMTALQMMDKIKSLGYTTQVVFVGGIQDVEAAIAMMEKGAKEVLFKTDNLLKEIDEVIW